MRSFILTMISAIAVLVLITSVSAKPLPIFGTLTVGSFLEGGSAVDPWG
jgi:hypothetical protein